MWKILFWHIFHFKIDYWMKSHLIYLSRIISVKYLIEIILFEINLSIYRIENRKKWQLRLYKRIRFLILYLNSLKLLKSLNHHLHSHYYDIVIHLIMNKTWNYPSHDITAWYLFADVLFMSQSQQAIKNIQRYNEKI